MNDRVALTAEDQKRRTQIKAAVEEAAQAIRVRVSKVYLFGSRVRGEADRRSDWDLLVVVEGELSWETHRKLFCEMSQRLAKIGIPADILVRTEAQLEKALQRQASVEKTALHEGVPL